MSAHKFELSDAEASDLAHMQVWAETLDWLAEN